MVQAPNTASSREWPYGLQTSKPQGLGCQSHWSSYHDAKDPRAGHEVIECSIYPDGFGFALFQSLVSMSLFLPFCMGLFPLCPCSLEACLCFYFIQSLSREPGLRPLNNVGTVKTMVTLEDGLNELCIKWWPYRERMVHFISERPFYFECLLAGIAIFF